MEEGYTSIASTADEYQTGRLLFKEYADSLDFDLGYQGFEKELEEIDQLYKAPAGALLLFILEDNAAVGCIAIRRLSEAIAELKRFYVRPGFRGLQIGKRLLEFALASAQNMGYQFIRLDTVPGQEKAQELYRKFGFYEIVPYRYSAIESTLFFEKSLSQ